MTDPDSDDDAPVAPRVPAWRRTQTLGLWWVLPIGLCGALVFWLQGHVRGGAYLIAAVLAAAAGLRLLLPRDAVGGLLVRSRAWDVATLLTLAVGVALLGSTLVIR